MEIIPPLLKNKKIMNKVFLLFEVEKKLFIKIIMISFTLIQGLHLTKFR
jgi:hypothetical protein